MQHRVRLFLFLVLVLASMLAVGCQSTQQSAAAGPAGPGAMPPVPVTVAVASQEAFPLELHAIGNVEASATIQVKSQVAGELRRVAFTEGAMVNKGDLLFEIDQQPYQDALRQAQSALDRDSALLHQAEANLARDNSQLKTAEADAGRYEQLSREGVISKQQSDQARNSADSSKASIRADQAAIESARASVESDKAAIDRAKLDLVYCVVRSPVSGRAGNILVNAGNLIKASTDAVVVVNQVTPIYVSFAIPEQNLAAVRKESGGRKLEVEVSPQDNPGQKIRGLLSVIDNTVDTTTGTIKLKATFKNTDRLLWPGQFVNVSLTLSTQSNATVVPAEAVQPGQQGQMIYVVKADKTVEPRIVTVGATRSGKVIVERGIAPGETVVTDGQLRLFPGARIQAVPASKADQAL